MSKWIYVSIVVLSILLGIVVGVIIPTDTNTEYNKLVKYAKRQSVEIAIIEQASKLLDYKQQLSKIKQQAQLNPQPAIVDSGDVNDDK